MVLGVFTGVQALAYWHSISSISRNAVVRCMPDPPPSSRRDLFSALNPVRASRKRDFDAISVAGLRIQPAAGITVRLSARVMACDFAVIMNPGPTEQIEVASAALELVHAIEGWLSIYRESSELSAVNQTAAVGPVHVRRELFELLQKAAEIHMRTDGAFDLATGSLTRLWRACRRDHRIPVQIEIDAALNQAGLKYVDLHVDSQTVAFRQSGIVLDPGAIGKGYALDEAKDWLGRFERSFRMAGWHRQSAFHRKTPRNAAALRSGHGDQWFEHPVFPT